MKRILSRTIVVLFLFCTASAQNDWQLLELEEYAVEYVYAKGDTIWASILDTNYKYHSYRSFNGGSDWIQIDDSDTLMNGSLMLLEVSPYDILTIYGFSYGGRGLKSTDGGETWEDVSAFPSSSHGVELSFAYDPIDSTKAYVDLPPIL